MVPSDRCGVQDLWLPFDLGATARAVLDLRPGWVRRWSATWRVAGKEVVVAVGDLGSAPPAGCEPVRRFGWHRRQRHRPGLQFMVSTGRHHGFESLAEQRLLLALDFAGVVLVVSQPFRLRFVTRDGWRDHTLDFVGVLRDGSTWLVDVRPQVLTTLDALSAQRRPLADRLGLQVELMAAAAAGPCAFGVLVAATSLPAAARAHALHLLWHRRLGVDLAAPLNDTSLVRPSALAGRW